MRQPQSLCRGGRFDLAPLGFAALGQISHALLLLLALDFGLLALAPQVFEFAHALLFRIASRLFGLALGIGLTRSRPFSLQLLLALLLQRGGAIPFGPLTLLVSCQRLLPGPLLALSLLQSLLRGQGLALGLLFTLSGFLLVPLGLDLRRGVDQHERGHRWWLARLPVEAAEPQHAEACQVNEHGQSQCRGGLPQPLPTVRTAGNAAPVHCSGGSPMNPIAATPACCSSSMAS